MIKLKSAVAVAIVALAWGGHAGAARGDVGGTAPPVTGMNALVPQPVTVQPAAGTGYPITASTTIQVEAGSAPVEEIGIELARVLRRSTGYALPVAAASASSREAATADGISLLLSGAGAELGDEGYLLDVSAGGVVVRANQPEGLFNGVQTLRQLLPAAADSATVQPGPWPVPAGHIADHPRFPYRGAMLDVSRHFFPVATVERYIDEISLYKVNRLHLHLADDQGWRIAITSWPQLAAVGGSTAVGGGPGGYYTQADYRTIVDYARAHYVTIVPEIDGPGHTNAALASYPALNCTGKAPPLYTGTDVGFSSLCVGKEITYTFLDNVLGELAELTPGPYLHIGGDEAQSTKAKDYATFEGKELPLVAGYGRAAMAWHDIAAVTPPTSTVLEYWGTTTSEPKTAAAVARGNKVVLAPANKAYLDMKYSRKTKLGQNWAGYIEEQTAYDWNPGSYLGGVGESAVLGVEAPLWSETLVTLADLEFMAFPRLPAIAELGWSPAATHDWTSFRSRLGAQGPRWTVLGIGFFASAQIPWAPGTRTG
ncbi:beta-N-acetylhexosaminidase [Amycolatopsis vastitatis]|uniref:beta-N-acetylhexosaminidase n=1 Tax=Amycolatopsis vastitatis TaxID=1905142 RepID=A0A229SQF7_9PSEU|nr:beta-N-acetylhexosaminidase [Amycolatopsis vastitatis]OXM61116.1 beta-N-acetylhexosaminidase [Amycolatopsis vastitatis]